MNREAYEARLADYLGDELSHAERAEFETYLLTNTEARAEVEELRATLEELAHLQIVPEIPSASPTIGVTARVLPPQKKASHFFTALLKAAAVLMFGVLIGRATAPPPTDEHASSNRTAFADATTVHPGWIELVKNLDANQGSLAGSLRMFANLTR